MGADADKPADLLQGTLELLILRTLATGEKHGYEIAEWIHVASAEALSVEEGALYPALASARAARAADGGMGRLRQQPARQVLPAHRQRPEAA